MKPILRLARQTPVATLRTSPAPIRAKREPLRLQPIPWGTPDAALARGVCRHIRDAMPDLVIPFNPKTHRKLRIYLREHGYTH